MKNKIIILFATFIFLSVSFISCAGNNSLKNSFSSEDKTDENISESFITPKFIVEGNNKFAIEMYKKINKKSERTNFFFSPYSIYTAFAMLFEGSSSTTRTELINIFGFEDNDLIRQNAFKNTLSKYQDKSKQYGIFMANSLWTNQNFNVFQSYVENLKANYYAEANTIDFSKSSSEKTINKWVEKNTADKIKDLIPESIFNKDTRAVLVNTIYFKEKWLIPFNASETKKEDFYIPGGPIKTVDLMKQKDKYFHYENSKVQVLKMKYIKSSSSDISMIVVLPKSNNIEEAEKYIYNNTIEKINSSLAVDSGIIYFPKFEMKWHTDILSFISDMGLISSDYSKISQIPLYVSNVFHGSFIKIDEEETEAAAATAIVLVKGVSIEREEPPFVFRADKPFVYMIIDEEDGKILFLGKFYTPENE